MRNWEDLSINDALQQECSKLELFLSSNCHQIIRTTTDDFELQLSAPIKERNNLHLGCKRVRLTKRKYTKEPLRKLINRQFAIKDQNVLHGNLERTRNVKFNVIRPNIPVKATNEMEIGETRMLELALSSSQEKCINIRLSLENVKLAVSRESLEVKNSVRRPKVTSLFRKNAICLNCEPAVMKLEKPKLKITKFTIITNLILFQEPSLAKFLQEFSFIYEREDDFNFLILQTSSTTNIALLKPSSTVTSLPNWITDAVILCTEEKIPNRQLLEFLYSMRVKVSYFLRFESLMRLLTRTAGKATYLSEMETVHERLLTRGLGISSFKAQSLLSVKPLSDILLEHFVTKS